MAKGGQRVIFDLSPEEDSADAAERLRQFNAKYYPDQPSAREFYEELHWRRSTAKFRVLPDGIIDLHPSQWKAL